PQYAYDEVSQSVLEPVQDTLLQYNVMKTDPYEVEPCILEAMPEKTVNADGTVTYLCRMKSGILYHDDPCFPGGKGREVVAADESFAFQRICDPAEECPIYAVLATYVDGMSEAFETAQKAGHFDYEHQQIRGLEVVDDHTFRIHLKNSYPQIIYWLAMAFTA